MLYNRCRYMVVVGPQGVTPWVGGGGGGRFGGGRGMKAMYLLSITDFNLSG